jgi:myo-inositol-hexaphosphate 3-phosphohydrolase
MIRLTQNPTLKIALFAINLALLLILPLAAEAFGQPEPLKPVAISEPGRNVDSMAVWLAPNITDSLILLTEKSGGQIMVFKADKTATLIKRFGELKRPNAVAIVPKVKVGNRVLDLAFVTERDGDIVSVFSIPDFEKVGEFASEVHQPMGIAVYRNNRDILAFVVSKRATGDEKVIRFRVRTEGGKVSGIRELHFGKELTPNQETVFVDDKRRLVFVADETARNIKVYKLNGSYIRTFGDGAFQAQVEGIAIVRCRKTDYLIASDQRETTEFEIFDLKDYSHVGTVVTTAKHTDGIAVSQAKLRDFPNGIFIAQSDPDGSGGLQAELYDLKYFLERAGITCR